MEQQPFISVIIPCYNQGHFLQEAVISVFAQTYGAWECIIVNDGSTDSTAQIANHWCRKDGRFSYILQENRGLSAARNKGLAVAKGDYIQFLDADDTLDTHKFSVSVQNLQGADLLITNFHFFSARQAVNHFVAPSFNLGQINFTFKTILTDWDEKFVIPIHCGLFKRTLFESIRFNESLKAKEDWLMWLQVFKTPVHSIFIDQSFANYRISPAGMSQDRSRMTKNLIRFYELAYEITPEQDRADLFQKALKKMGELLEESDHLIGATRQSYSFRFGNFFVRKLGGLKHIFTKVRTI